MPWNSNSGGGGGWKGGGPWGAGPPGRGPQPPQLEDLLRKSQDRLRSALPGGRGNAAAGVLVAAAIVALWLFNSFYMVQPDEIGQELVFGKPKPEVSQQGLHFIFWPVETVEKVPTFVQTESIGNEASRRNSSDSNTLMLSADQNIVDVNFSVQWRVTDPKKYLFAVEEPRNFLRRVSESAMRELVGRSTAEQVRTGSRAEVEEGVRALSQGTLDSYDSGITIVGVNLERADPPQEVAESFEEVQRAQQDLERFQREADAYANKRLGDARGQAAQISEQSIGYRQQVVAEAQGESQRFNSVLTEYQRAPEVTRERLFLETMERVLGGANKIILDQPGGPGVLPYLQVGDVLKNQPARPAGSTVPGAPPPTPAFNATPEPPAPASATISGATP